MASKRRQIIEAAQAALQSITVLNGYHSDMKQVYRGLKYFEDLVGEDKFPCLCFAGLKETRSNMNKTQFRSTVLVTLIGYVKIEDSTDSLQEAMDDTIEDVTKALEVDRTFGHLSTWMEIQSIETDRGDQDKHGAFAMEVAFHYAAAGSTP